MNLRALLLWSVAVLLLTCFPALAQVPVFRSINLGEGKKTLKVQAIAQNSEHYIFYGTNAGLVRYDGVVYSPIPFPDSLGKVSVTALYFDSTGLWIGTAKGDVFVMRGEELLPFTAGGFSTDSKISHIAGGTGLIGIATYGDGVYFYNPTADNSEHLTALSGFADDFVYDLLWFDGKIWAGTDAGIAELDPANLSATQYSMKNGLPDNIVRSLCRWDDTTLVIGMHDYGLSLLNTRSLRIRPLQPGASAWMRGSIEDILKDQSGRLWVATGREGIVCFEATDAGGVACKALTEINGLSSNRVLSLMEDAEHNVWIGTQEGVSLYSGSTFEYLSKNEGLSGKSFYDVIVDKQDNIWMASEAGVMRYAYNETGEGLAKLYLENSTQIVCLMEDSRGTIWMGSYGDGLFCLNPEDGRITRYSKAEGLSNTNIMDMAVDGKGRLWLATLGSGVVRVDFSQTKPTFTSVEDVNALPSQYIYTLKVDSAQLLWIGSDGGGVAIYDCENDRFKPSLDELSTASVFSIAEGRAETWIATSEKGVFRYKRGVLTQFLEASGLRSNSVTALQTLPNGDLVAIHPLGIDVLPFGAEMFTPHNVNKPAFLFEPYLNATFVKNGAVWIGSESGVVRFSPHDRAIRDIAPKVILTGLRVLYEEMPLSQSEYGYEQNHFVFDYLGVWMQDPQAVVYQYMLDGFDVQWSFETESRVATYSSLPPGEYTFKVRAGNGDGRWSDPALSSYSFVILKPFWMQWWFYVSLAVLLALMVGAFVRYRTQKLVADKKRLESEVEKRTKEITHQKEVIEYKNHEILGSITYAKRIQSAILPPDKLIKAHFPESFVLYKPKDIVAGDFYWLEAPANLPNEGAKIPEGGEAVFIAACDCTGHGVPGAMVSVVCNNALNRSVREYSLTTPSLVLDKTRQLVIEQFMLSEEEVKDGMDIALCSLRHEGDGQATLEFAGAQNPLWIVSERSEIERSDGTKLPSEMTENGLHLVEIKPDKQPIGRYADLQPFVNHSIKLKKGDIVFLFTDGYADQFGGERGKKFKYKPMKSLVLSLARLPMNDLKLQLDLHFEQWRGSLEQVDDVCVIGLRV